MYGLFPVCVLKPILKGVWEWWKPLWSTSSLGSHQVFLGDKSVQMLQAEKKWEESTNERDSKRGQGAGSLQINKQQLHGGIKRRQPSTTAGRKRNLAEVWAQKIAKLKAHQPDCIDLPAKVK